MSRYSGKKQNGIQLPFQLRQELGLADQGNQRNGRKGHHANRVTDRKDRRRAMRVEKKGGQAPRNFRNQQSRQQRFEEGDELEDEDDGPEDDRDNSTEDEPTPLPPPKSKLNRTAQASDIATRPKPILQRPKPTSITQYPSPSESDESRASSPELVLDASSRAFKERVAQDDSEIAALEKRLGMKKKKSKSTGDDELDFLLDGLDGEDDGKKRKREGQEWLEKKRRKYKDQDFESDEEDALDGFEQDDLEMGEEDESSANEGDDDFGSADDDLYEVSSRKLPAEGDDFADFDSEDRSVSEEEIPKKTRENPYVAPVTPGATAKYVPPSLRKRTEGQDESLEHLRRQVQGQLNKLSEANMISILGEIEKLYRTNPRQDVTTVLIDLLLSLFSIRSSLQNTFIILHAAFVAAVYKIMGTDFGAEILVKLVEKFESEYKSSSGGKEALNLISLLSNLFTFGVISSHIVYDHIRLLLSDFNESNAELLLRVVRDCGPQLRSDDPSALKSIVQTMQQISADMASKGQQVNVRTTVMMDTITDLKNNKMKNATNAAGVTGEHITRMRKALGALNNRNLKATEPLRVTRNDIANSEKKGKWWLVGASWKGNDSTVASAKDMHDESEADNSEDETDEEVDLLVLAKQYRMNTDVRRSIFVAIMSATDVKDAQTRILKLRLTNKQEQEIARVLLRCARAEPIYNPYYALLAKSLCKDNRKIRMGFQFGLWDFFKRMGEKADEEDGDGEEESESVEMAEIVNVAKTYAYLISHDHLTIGLLKTLNIGFLREQATMFLEILLISIMTQAKMTEDNLLKVFGRATETPQIAKTLQYFLKKQVRKSDLVAPKDREKVKDACKVADVALGMVGKSGVDLE